MWAVIEYFNYHGEQRVKIMHVTISLKQANKIAKEYAKNYAEERHENVVEGVEESWLDVRDAKYQYTTSNGYDRWVYAVIKLPEIEDENENESENDQKTS